MGKRDEPIYRAEKILSIWVAGIYYQIGLKHLMDYCPSLIS